MKTEEFIEFAKKNGNYQVEMYSSKSRLRQLTMQLAIWVSEQLQLLEDNAPTLMVNKLFEKVHVILTAANIELAR